MFEEELPEAEVSAVEPVEVSAAPVVEPTTAPATPGEAVAATATDPASWDGEIASVESQEWWSAIPEDQRETVKEGLKTKHSHWDSSYTKKMQDLADQRREAEEKHQHAEAMHKRALTWLNGGEDPTVELREELTGVKQQLTAAQTAYESALTTMRTEHTRALEEAAKRGGGEVQRVMAEAQVAKAELERIREVESHRADEIARVEATKLESRLTKEAPDIWEGDPEAFLAFAELMTMGQDFDKAVKMVRAAHDLPSRPEADNDAEDLMASGSPGINARTQSRRPPTTQQLLQRKQAEAGASFRLED